MNRKVQVSLLYKINVSSSNYITFTKDVFQHFQDLCCIFFLIEIHSTFIHLSKPLSLITWIRRFHVLINKTNLIQNVHLAYSIVWQQNRTGTSDIRWTNMRFLRHCNFSKASTPLIIRELDWMSLALPVKNGLLLAPAKWSQFSCHFFARRQ